jgi:hypothetical protein
MTLKRAANALSSQLAAGKGKIRGPLSELMGPISSVFGSTPHPSPGWRHARPQDLTLLHEIETAISAFKGDSRISGAAIDDVSRSLMSRYASDVPQAVGSAMPLTVKDFMTRGMGMSNLLASVGPDSVRNLQTSLKELARLPGLRQSLARQGMTVDQFLGRVSVGAYMMKTDAGVLSARGGLRTLLEDTANIRLPFTQFKPFSLLIPDLTPKPGMTFLGPKYSKAAFGAQDALFIKGQVYPITEAGGQRLLGRPSAGYRLASTRQAGAARAAAARMGLLLPHKRPIAGRRDLPRAQRILDIQMRRMERRFGVGPAWAGRRSRLANILGRARAVATGAKPEFPAAIGTPAAGLTPEGAFLSTFLRRPQGRVKGPQDLSFVERVRLAAGGVISRPFVEEGRFGTKIVAHTPTIQGLTRKMPRPFGRAEFYATQGAQGVSDWMNWQVNRPLWLLSEMTGLGMRPGRSPLESFGHIGLKIAAPAYVGYQALEYAEYKSNRWLGFGPITGPAYLYTQARLGAQHALDAVGVTDFLRNTEEQYPGSIESPASRGIRGGATVLAGLLGARATGNKYAKMAALAGGTVLGYLQLAGINTPANEMQRIYSGEQDVPVRSGRWWMLGRKPFGGGKIARFEPSWYHQLKTRPKEIGLYGSRQEARRSSWLPTPENLFNLKNLYDPYYLSREHWHDRPYPETAGHFGSVPIVGPIAERTIGRILKPVQRREIPVSADSQRGVGEDDYRQALSLGYGPKPERAATPQSDRLDIMTGETIYRLFDWTGLPGFMVGALREQLTGTTGWYADRKAMATSAAMASTQRDYYDRNIGGGIGLTEMLRRFIPNDQGYRHINNLENRMPDWLPGKRSVFMADRENYINFAEGDAFTKIEKGEMRLPGPGFEAAHRGVDDGTPGMYSSLERYQILADVAPGSQAYKHYRRAVHGQIQLGLLERQDVERFTRIENQASESLKSRAGAVGFRYGADEFAEKEVTVADTGLTTFTTHEHPGMTFHLAGVEDRTYALEGSRDTYGKLRRRMAELQGKTLSITYGGFGPTTPAILGDTNRWAIDAGLGKYKPVDDLDFRAKHGTNVFRQGYEWMLHTSLPGPLGYPRTKFVGGMAAIEEYDNFVRMGTWDTGWEQPIQNYVVPWSNQLMGATSTAQLKTRRVNEYVDHFKFAKYAALEQRADAMGDTAAANKFHSEAGRTMVAANPYAPGFYKNIFGALPPTEKPYFAAFAGVTSERRQEQILGSVPSNMAPIYVGVWERQAGTAGFASPVLQRYAEEAQRIATERPEDRVAEYFAHQPLPDASYAGNHPAVNEDMVRLKMARREGLDAHQMGLWQPQAIEAEALSMPAPQEAPELSREDLEALLRYHGYMQGHGMYGVGPGSSLRVQACG